MLLRAAALPRLAAVPAAGKLVGKVVDLNYYPWYLVTSERANAGAFASREVLPMSSLTEKERWCDLHLKRLQANPNAKPKGGWSRVCAAPASNASRWAKWRADNAQRLERLPHKAICCRDPWRVCLAASRGRRWRARYRRQKIVPSTPWLPSVYIRGRSRIASTSSHDCYGWRGTSRRIVRRSSCTTRGSGANGSGCCDAGD